MNHLSDEVLNEFLDNALAPEIFAETQAHLAACQQCAAQLAELTGLFADLAALPEIPLDRDLSMAVLARIAPREPLPRPVPWVLAFQTLAILLLMTLAAPFLDIASSIPANLIHTPAPSEVLAFLSAESMLWARSIQFFNLQTTLPVWNFPPLLNLSGLALGITLLSVFILWLVANRLLLRLPGETLSRS
jgi:anti-sigma factor RsiW